jgi:hypothetical protein
VLGAGCWQRHRQERDQQDLRRLGRRARIPDPEQY